jgi:ribosomal protein L7/L12
MINGDDAQKLQFMSDSDRMDILLKLLESNPSIVRSAIEEKEKTTMGETYKVIAKIYKGAGKLPLIFAFRTIHRCSLGEAKDWAEGKPYNSLQSGVLKQNLSMEEARTVSNCARNCINGAPHIYIDAVKNSVRVDKFPSAWGDLPNDPFRYKFPSDSDLPKDPFRS